MQMNFGIQWRASIQNLIGFAPGWDLLLNSSKFFQSADSYSDTT